MSNLEKKLSAGWVLVNRPQMEKDFKFDDFQTALAFAKDVAQLAQTPKISIGAGKVKLAFPTHPTEGPTEADCILAALLDKLG